MRSVTQEWQDSIAASHKLSVLVTVLTTEFEYDLPLLVDGNVTLDSTAATRGRCDITLIDDGSWGIVPTSPSDLLAPYGNEIQIKRGIEYPDGSIELVSLGIFRLQDVDVNDTGVGMEIRISAPDRSDRIIDARFEDPWQVDAGTNYGTAILDTLLDAWPEMEYQFATTTLVSPQLIAEEGEDRWAFCQSMASSIGMELYFDGDGVCILRPAPSVGSPVYSLVEGENEVLIGAARNWTRQGSFNRVISTGENLGDDTPPARGVATDDNPDSPTYYYGPFGKVPRFYSSSFIATDEQATEASNTILLKELGTTQKVSFGSLVDPALEPGDVARITRLRAGIDEDHVIESLTIPLSAQGTMDGSTRATVIT